MSKRVAFILSRNARFSPCLQTGAVEMTVADLALASAHREKIEVIGPQQTDKSGQDVSTYEGVRYQSVMRPANGKKKGWHKAILEQISVDPPDVLIVEQSPATARFFKRAMPDVYVVLHRHDAQPVSSFLKRLLQDHAMRCADLILANSKFTQNHHVIKRGQAVEKVALLYNGVVIPPRSKTTGKNKTIICVAAMVPKKGAHLFALAAARLAPAYPDWQFVFISESGGKASHDYREPIWNALENSPGNFLHREFIPHAEVLNYFAKASIAVVPSQCDESFGRTAAEAAAHGCAIIHSNRGGLPEVAGLGGVVCKDQTVESYVNELERLMLAPEECRNLGRNARNHAKAIYDINKIGRQFDALIFE